MRAELEEQDYGAIKIGQQAIIRADAFRDRDFAGPVALIAPIVSGRLSEPGQHNLMDVNVAEVLINLAGPSPLVVGMKVNVYFQAGTTVSTK